MQKKKADASTLFRCRPKASTAIDLILVDILSLSTDASFSGDPKSRCHKHRGCPPWEGTPLQNYGLNKQAAVFHGAL